MFQFTYLSEVFFLSLFYFLFKQAKAISYGTPLSVNNDTSYYTLPFSTTVTVAPNPFTVSVSFVLSSNESSQITVVFKIVDLNMQEQYTQSVTIDA